MPTPNMTQIQAAFNFSVSANTRYHCTQREEWVPDNKGYEITDYFNARVKYWKNKVATHPEDEEIECLGSDTQEVDQWKVDQLKPRRDEQSALENPSNTRETQVRARLQLQCASSSTQESYQMTIVCNIRNHRTSPLIRMQMLLSWVYCSALVTRVQVDGTLSVCLKFSWLLKLFVVLSTMSYYVEVNLELDAEAPCRSYNGILICTQRLLGRCDRIMVGVLRNPRD